MVDGRIIALASAGFDQIFISIDPTTGTVTAGPGIDPLDGPAVSDVRVTDAGVFASTSIPCGVAPVDVASLTIGPTIAFPTSNVCGSIGVIVGSVVYTVEGTLFIALDTATGAIRTADAASQLPADYSASTLALYYDGMLLASFAPRSGDGPRFGARVDPASMEVQQVVEMPGDMVHGPGHPVIQPALGDSGPTLAVDPATLQTTPTDDFPLAYDLEASGVESSDGNLWISELSFPGDPDRQLRVRGFSADLQPIGESRDVTLPGLVDDSKSTHSQRVVSVPIPGGLLVIISTNTTETTTYTSTSQSSLFRVSIP